LISTVKFNKRIFLWSVAILLLLSCSIGVYFGVRHASNAPYNGITIVLDAGHGGVDGGVVGLITKVKEADINLSITKTLKKILETRGYRVVLTRKNSNGLYGLATTDRKIRDMKARQKIIEDNKPELVVSIHQNSFPLKNQTGAQVFYSIGGTNESANIVQEQLNLLLDGKDRVSKKGDYYILNCTMYNSILVECGFLTTPQEERLLVSASYQQRVAYAIFSGINMLFFRGN